LPCEFHARVMPSRGYGMWVATRGTAKARARRTPATARARRSESREVTTKLSHTTEAGPTGRTRDDAIRLILELTKAHFPAPSTGAAIRRRARRNHRRDAARGRVRENDGGPNASKIERLGASGLWRRNCWSTPRRALYWPAARRALVREHA